MSNWLGYVLCAVLGVIGGFAMQSIGSPLPWYIGPLMFNAIPALMGLPVRGLNMLRPVALPVLGVVLGSAFLPDIFTNAGGFIFALSLIPVFIIASSAVNYLYYRRVAHLDPITSYLSSVPGGLNDMILLGEESGGDARQIALSHSLRVIVSVVGIAVLVVLIAGDHSAQATERGLVAFGDVPPVELLILAGCAALGPLVGRLLRIPARAILGALILSAIAHLTQIVHTAPPSTISRAAQMVLGGSVGASFAGMHLRVVARSMMHGLIAAVLAICVSASIALIAYLAGGMDFFASLLSYAPGGLMEMSLLALAINQSVAFVTIAHTTRYVVVMFTAIFIFNLMHKRDERDPP